ncbi:SH3 domain-containing protein [Mesorhizobium sp. M0663]
MELTCKRGQIVTASRRVLCRAEGRTGWVPKNHLAVRTA